MLINIVNLVLFSDILIIFVVSKMIWIMIMLVVNVIGMVKLVINLMLIVKDMFVSFFWFILLFMNFGIIGCNLLWYIVIDLLVRKVVYFFISEKRIILIKLNDFILWFYWG